MENQKSSKTIKNIDKNWGLPLPTHMAPLIFSKLSISNLPLCRFVCKSWNHLVLNYALYSFPKVHLPSFIILSTCDRISNNPLDLTNPKIHCFDINTLSFVASHTLVEPNITSIMIRNCCNGLFYIRKFYKLQVPYIAICEGIFNPMTHEFFKIPFCYDLLHSFFYPGFGFSTKTRQYKILLAHFKTTCEMKILRLGCNPDHKWISIYVPSPINIRSRGVYMNGVIYWIGIEKNNRNVTNIYALDVETEHLELVMALDVPYCYHGKLQLLNGTIYAIIYIKSIHQIQLWKMQSKDFWIKDFIIPGKFKTLPQLLKVEDGKILVRIKNRLFWLRYEKKILKKDKIKTLIPRNRRFTSEHSWLIDSLHFGSIPTILAGDD